MMLLHVDIGPEDIILMAAEDIKRKRLQEAIERAARLAVAMGGDNEEQARIAIEQAYKDELIERAFCEQCRN